MGHITFLSNWISLQEFIGSIIKKNITVRWFFKSYLIFYSFVRRNIRCEKKSLTYNRFLQYIVKQNKEHDTDILIQLLNYDYLRKIKTMAVQKDWWWEQESKGNTTRTCAARKDRPVLNTFVSRVTYCKTAHRYSHLDIKKYDCNN